MWNAVGRRVGAARRRCKERRHQYPSNQSDSSDSDSELRHLLDSSPRSGKGIKCD